MNKRILLTCLFIMILLISLTSRVNAIDIEEVYVSSFDYLLEGPVPNHNHVMVGFSNYENPRYYDDYMNGFYDYAPGQTSFIRWDDDNSCWVEMDGSDILVADGTHYGIKFSLWFKNGGTAIPDMAVYINTTNEENENKDRNYTTYGHSQIVPYGSNNNVAICFIDYGPALEACEITFDTDGGTEFESQRIPKGTKIDNPGKPDKEGVLFVGWYTDSEFNNKFDINTPVNNDLTLHAKFQEPILIDNASITFELPEQGTMIETDLENYEQIPQLDFSIQDGEHYEVMNMSEKLRMIWYDIGIHKPLDGVAIEPETEYTIFFYLVAEDGYCFAEDAVITVNGDEIELIDFASDRTAAEVGYTFTTPKVYTVEFDVNGGEKVDFEVPESIWGGTTFELDAMSEDEITPPEGKEFDAFEINGKRYEKGSSYTITEDSKVKILWKDKEVEKEKEYTIPSGTFYIVFTDVENKVFDFEMFDILALTDEEIVDLGGTREEADELIEKVKEAVKEKGTLLSLYQIVLSEGGADVHTVDDGFKIRIKITEALKGYNSFKLIYVKDDFTTEEPITLTQNGEYLEGTLKHLSGYALVGEAEETTTTSNPKTGDTIVIWISLMIVSILGLAIIKRIK